ncbi:hypothetical protein [Sphingomonas sp. Sph1(2015)]|uniref:hypothetical protein n=1 Tax=Sphingomonas sp. Sph1(2015) TaxID=1628084 RepID=UPI0013010F7F|nr:hypothetical protein [Sphingomonas sp. Sph1(2015)]
MRAVSTHVLAQIGHTDRNGIPAKVDELDIPHLSMWASAHGCPPKHGPAAW